MPCLFFSQDCLETTTTTSSSLFLILLLFLLILLYWPLAYVSKGSSADTLPVQAHVSFSHVFFLPLLTLLSSFPALSFILYLICSCYSFLLTSLCLSPCPLLHFTCLFRLLAYFILSSFFHTYIPPLPAVLILVFLLSLPLLHQPPPPPPASEDQAARLVGVRVGQ